MKRPFFAYIYNYNSYNRYSTNNNRYNNEIFHRIIMTTIRSRLFRFIFHYDSQGSEDREGIWDILKQFQLTIVFVSSWLMFKRKHSLPNNSNAEKALPIGSWSKELPVSDTASRLEASFASSTTVYTIFHRTRFVKRLYSRSWNERIRKTDQSIRCKKEHDWTNDEKLSIFLKHTVTERKTL